MTQFHWYLFAIASYRLDTRDGEGCYRFDTAFSDFDTKSVSEMQDHNATSA